MWEQERQSQGCDQAWFHVPFTKMQPSSSSDRSTNHLFSREELSLLGKKKKGLNLFVCFLTFSLKAVLIIY